MTPHRHGKHPPPPDGVERRRQFRREEDVEKDVIIEHAVEDAPIVNRLLKTGKVASAVGAIFLLLGMASAALGYRLIGPADDVARQQAAFAARVEANSERITKQSLRTDSLLDAISAIKKDLQTMTYIQCVQLRRNDPDLLPDGCSPAAQRNRKN